MAAWIGVAVGIVIAVLVGAGVYWVMKEQARRDRESEARLRELALSAPKGDDELLRRVLERLMDVVVPERKPDDGQPEDDGPAEYEEPADDWAGALDWTDPFLGVERPTVARLAPGQGIPGVTQTAGDVVDTWREKGEGAFDEWARDSYMPDAANAAYPQSWVAPIDLGNGETVE